VKSREFIHRGTRDAESRGRKSFGPRTGKTFTKSSSEKPALSLKRSKKVVEPAPVSAIISEAKTGTIRLNKFISNAGITSRRKADELIASGAVTVNGKKVTELGVQVKPYEDHITVNGETISLKPRYIYLLLNKPKDTITTTSDEKDRTTVLDYVQTEERVYPVGRLDRNTTGVLLLTNDGELTNRLTHPSFEIEREYHVTLDKPLVKHDAKKIAEGGIDIGDGDITGASELSFLETNDEVLLKIKEGKNREVRRIFESLGYEVAKLDRIMFAGITHRGMSRGESRTLTPQEIHRLKDLAGMELS
jgi:23S rRNA pseudouridine2605 synthase